MTQKIVSVPGKHVMVKWKRIFEGQCPSDNFFVYYKEVNSTQWKFRNVSKGANQYDLELECFKKYDVAVTAERSQNSENVEAPRDASNHWKVLTGQGKNPSFSLVKKNPNTTREKFKDTVDLRGSILFHFILFL